MPFRALKERYSNYNNLWLQALFILFLLTTRSETGEITLGFLLPFNVPTNNSAAVALTSAKDFASAFLLAVEAVNDSSLLPGNRVTFVLNDTQCNDDISIKTMLYQLERGVQVIIGPGCTCATEAKLAAAANVPMVSYVSTTDIDEI